MMHRKETSASLRRPWLGRVPLLVAAAVICLITGWNLVRLMIASAPRNPWEAAEVVEAWRSLKGLPVYEFSPEGHATHMYGAFVPVVQAELFRLVGPNNVSGRALSLVSALLTVTLIAITMRSERSVSNLVISWAMILGVNHRSGQYFAENRPDMPAILCATLALFLMGIGLERRRWRYVVLGSACLVTGFFFKQSVAVMAAVPLVVLIVRARRPAAWEIFFSFVPLAVMCAVILGLKRINPAVYHYMIEVPGGYNINWPRAVKFVWELLLDSPLFLFAVGEWIIFDQGSVRKDPRIPWLLAVLAVAIPTCAVAHAKVGGWPNSLLPAFLAMTAFCALRLPGLFQRVDNQESPPRSRLVNGAFLAVLVLMTTFPHLRYEDSLLVPRSPQDQGYWPAVAYTRGLPGTVVCPEDPTIPLYAKGFAGRNLFTEKDALPTNGAWPTFTPQPVLDELRLADYVVDVTNYERKDVEDGLLERLGFEPIPLAPVDLDCYKFWRRKGSGRAFNASRVAVKGSEPARLSSR
jgi:Dolichyl-phosphate-mannose-protein mannosyltransferase